MEAIDRLAVKVFSCLTRKQRKKIFGKDQKQSDFCDKVNSEFREFQTEVIPEEYYIQEQSSQGKPTIYRIGLTAITNTISANVLQML